MTIILTPSMSIAAAIAAGQDDIGLHDGTYREQLSKAGAPVTTPVRIWGVPGELVTIDGTDTDGHFLYAGASISLENVRLANFQPANSAVVAIPKSAPASTVLHLAGVAFRNCTKVGDATSHCLYHASTGLMDLVGVSCDRAAGSFLQVYGTPNSRLAAVLCWAVNCDQALMLAADGVSGLVSGWRFESNRIDVRVYSAKAGRLAISSAWSSGAYGFKGILVDAGSVGPVQLGLNRW